MARSKTNTEEYKALFVKLHKLQHKGANCMISLLTRHLRSKADYMASYIDLVAERSGVSPTGHITTTNADVMLPIVRAMVEIEQGIEPKHKELAEAWASFIEDFRNNKIRL